MHNEPEYLTTAGGTLAHGELPGIGEEDTFPAEFCGNCLGTDDVKFCPGPGRRLCSSCRYDGTEWAEPTSDDEVSSS